MKKALLLAITPLLLACSGDSIKKSLKEHVVDRSSQVDVKYKLISYEIIDTVTVGEMVDSICDGLALKEEELDLEEFKRLRNQEFTLFRTFYPDYEEDIMRGELKDASPWTTELRQITERADSLIKNWDKVTWSSYDYNYLCWWYRKRAVEYSDEYLENELDRYIVQYFELIEESEATFAELNNLLTMDREAVYRYVVLHNYSIYNPLFKTRLKFTDKAYFNDKMELVGYED